jgi:UDP-N-acetylmuramate dehydrogenase
MEKELSGLEFLAGIPGSVGGAIAMNAGARGREICTYVDRVRLLSKAGKVRVKKMLPRDISYRKWRGRKDEIILAGRFILTRGSGAAIKKECLKNLAKRKARQPQAASAGSFFRNPAADFAGRLIEAAGLKGLRIGGAEVSPVHANFIVNRGAATASDILELKNIIQAKVQESAGIWLEPEVKILGD